ncbi:class I SAM-dependent methyltransferase [Rothia sp. P7208]|uniref:class I SAM-dependent methyltransferase n=1 Tax=Rothia sp. P7208 TaxID=3402660 RepID=UPI003AC2EEE0
MRDKSLWQIKKEQNPGHSQWYIQRFKTMQEQGADILGEARLIDAMCARGSRILDAGAGPGRIGSYLQKQGHQVIGIDIDSELIAEAQRVCPEAQWITADLADTAEVLGYSQQDIEAPQPFDMIVCAGNVMTFLAPSTRVQVLRGFATVLGTSGRAVIGFGAGRGYSFEDFFSDVQEAGLEVSQRFSTWDLYPYTSDASFLVAVLAVPSA